jgi:hypothetical protein
MECTIRKAINFIISKYIEPYQAKDLKALMQNQGGIDFQKIKTKFNQHHESIIKAVTAPEPLHYIADEVLFFYLAINFELANNAEYLLSRDQPLDTPFPIFPFPLVEALIPWRLLPRIEAWKEIEPYLLLFVGDNYFLRTPRLTNKQATAPIYCAIKDIHDLEEDEGILCYSSLTNLLLMVAECYETGAYYFHKSSTYGSWREDFSKSEPIFHKYHPSLPFRSPHESSHFLDNYNY